MTSEADTGIGDDEDGEEEEEDEGEDEEEEEDYVSLPVYVWMDGEMDGCMCA